MRAYDSIQTVRKASSMETSSREIEAIQKVRKYSMQVENSNVNKWSRKLRLKNKHSNI